MTWNTTPAAWLEDEDLMAPQRSLPWLPLLITGAAVAGAVWLTRSRGDELKDLAVERLIERPATGQSFLSLEQQLTASGERLTVRAMNASDTERNRELLRHIIGIERWGRARVQSAVLHRPWVMDGHHDYKPPRDKSVKELAEIFAEQRRRTAALAHTLHESPPRLSDKVVHNGLGPLSVRGWLRYLQYHAELESRKLT